MRNKYLLLRNIFGMILCIGAALLGGGAYAMADVEITDVPVTASPDDKGLETVLDKNATATHVTETGFNEEEIEKAISLFRPFTFPLDYDITNNAKQYNVKQYQVKHYRSGVNPLEDTLLNELTTNANMRITITTDDVASGNLNIFPEYADILIPGVDGENGQPVVGFVESRSETESKAVLFIYNCSEAVTLPAGTKLLQGAYACSESQMEVDPDNYQPVAAYVYLQKKIANITFTDEWLEIAKEVPFVLNDLKDNALYNFKRKNARTRWLGSSGKFAVKVKQGKMAPENVYHEEGIIRQLTMYYSYQDGVLTQADFNAISKMQFTLYAANTDARCYCGCNFIENMLNMPEANKTERDFFFKNAEEAGMKLRRWTNNFGTLDFVYDPTLDDIGYQDFCVVVDIKNAVHYVKRAQRTDHQDMKVSGGEPREAQRYFYSLIDCLALKGYNSILVGPASKLAIAQALANITSWTTKVDSLDDADQTAGAIYYLTADYGSFAKGSLVTWDGEWVLYKGVVNVA